MQHLESQEQQVVVKWARLASRQYPCLKWLHSSTSGVRLKNAIQGARLKEEGMVAGIPDLFLPYPLIENKKMIYAGLYIEMKRRKSRGVSQGTLSPAQKDFLEYANNVGYKALVAYGADEAIQAIKDYLRS